MTWFAFKNDGNVYDLNGVAEKQLAGTFAHGYATQAEAIKAPNDGANPVQAAMLAGFVTAASTGTGGISGVIQIVNVDSSGKPTGTIGPGNNPVTNAVPNPLAGLEGVAHIFGDFFSGITDPKMWRSLGWIVLGAVLFFVALFTWVGPKLKNYVPPIMPLPV